MIIITYNFQSSYDLYDLYNVQFRNCLPFYTYNIIHNKCIGGAVFLSARGNTFNHKSRSPRCTHCIHIHILIIASVGGQKTHEWCRKNGVWPRQGSLSQFVNCNPPQRFPVAKCSRSLRMFQSRSKSDCLHECFF